MYLLCGLGNPGKHYKYTRHNFGFRVIDDLVERYEFEKHKRNKTMEVYKGKIGAINCFLLKPLTFMNLSGVPIKSFSNYYKIAIQNIIVIHDDLDIKLGKIKFKKGGGNGGHNGLVSIDSHIGTEYNRLRLGIDHPGNKSLVENYVLEKFNNEDKVIVATLTKIISQDISYLLKNKIDLFLTKTNERLTTSKENNGL